jgi:hypothetical protein
VNRARLLGAVGAGLLVLCAVGFALRLRAGNAPPPVDGPLLHVPRSTEKLGIDGHLDEGAWVRGAARTGVFTGTDGQPGRPHSEARMLWGEHALYLALYAADRDIRAAKVPADAPLWTSGDTFQLVFFTADGERHIDLSPEGKVTDARNTDFTWQSGLTAGTDTDGTINDPSDEDEEWILELAIPLEALTLRGNPGERVGLSIRRCDIGPPRVCTSWGASQLVLD